MTGSKMSEKNCQINFDKLPGYQDNNRSRPFKKITGGSLEGK